MPWRTGRQKCYRQAIRAVANRQARQSPMQVVYWLLFLSAAYPLWLAWQGNRQTSLIQAVNWAVVAWVAWLGVLGFAGSSDLTARLDVVRYLALCLTGCAGVAVLGARRPGVGAWNFVVLGLLAVMLLPVAEGLVLGGRSLHTLRILFLAATLAVGILNYLPTRLAPAAVLLATGCTWEILTLIPLVPAAGWPGEQISPGWLCLGLTPWAGWLGWRMAPPPRSEFDRLWLDFRNRFGLVWGQRVREQFNRSATHAGWPVHLFWQGLALLNPGTAPPEPTILDDIVATLRALLKRFGPPEGPPAAPPQDRDDAA
jgi:hypothetical protein